MRAIQKRAAGGQTNMHPVQRVEVTTGDKVSGFFKWVASKFVQSRNSTYTLKPAAEEKFLRDIGAHDEKAASYKSGGAKSKVQKSESSSDDDSSGIGVGLDSVSRSNSRGEDSDEFIIDVSEEKESTNPEIRIPRPLTFSTRAFVRPPKGEDVGNIHVTGWYNDPKIEKLAKSKRGDMNELDGEIYSSGPDANVLVVNTTYSFPIGMAVGSILMYEGFYQASNQGKNVVREGLGEGTAAKHWDKQRELIHGPEKDDETKPLLDEKPKKKDTSVLDGIIYTQAAWKQYWS